MKSLVKTLLLAVFFLSSLKGQIVINEYSASNLKSFYDNYNGTEDWIEIYNNSSEEVSLGDVYLTDNENRLNKWKFPDGLTIPGEGYMLVYCSGRDEYIDGFLHTNFKLKQTKGTEVLVLSDGTDNNIFDSIELSITQLEHGYARSENGQGDWFISTVLSPGESNEINDFKVGYATTPKANYLAGYYTESFMVDLAEEVKENEVVRYTLDGKEPTENSEIFEGPIEISETTVLKLRTFSDDPMVLNSLIDFNTYFINEEFSLPVFSIAADSVRRLANGDKPIRPIGSLEFFDNQELITKSYGELNSHGQDSWVLDQRSLDWLSRDEMGYSAAVDTKLYNYSNRSSYQKIIFRASGDDNYPAIDDFDHEGSTHVRDEFVHELALSGGMHLDVRAVERCIVFLNGDYWGVYAMREKPDDHDYTKEYYGQDKYNIQYLQTWGSSWAQYGGEQAFEDWGSIRDFVLDNDMSIDANYQRVHDEIDLISLIDYLQMNLNVVASDWLNYNTGWWRGINPDGGHKKWGYILWDNDASFDYYINYSGVPDISPQAKPCDLEEIGNYMDTFFPQDTMEYVWGTDTFYSYPDPGRHEKIFFKLMEENQDFEDLYYGRYADLMNTVFSCENMLSKLDSMVNTIRPEMPRHIQRWGGSMDEWETNLAELRGFVEERCAFLDDGLTECYSVTGPYSVTLMAQPEGYGNVKINTIEIDEFPWSGDYFGTMNNRIEAIPSNDSISFSHWETTSGVNLSIEDANAILTRFDITGMDTLIAVFEGKLSSINDVVINEFMASNKEAVADQDGDFDDWIELYNKGTETIDLSGFGLSDDVNALGKYSIPEGTTLDADEYLIVWADDDQEQDGLHAQFKLSGSGESIYLTDTNGAVIDEVTFGEQITDQSMARRPNGTGDFEIGNHTFNGNNDVSGVNEFEDFDSFIAYPNPASHFIKFEWESSKVKKIDVQIFDQLGKEVLRQQNIHNNNIVDIQNIPDGIYTVMVNGKDALRINIVD